MEDHAVLLTLPSTVTDGNDNASFGNFSYYGLTFTDNTPVDLVLRIDDSDGTTEYGLMVRLGNATGVEWTGFVFELGFGKGADFAAAGLAGLDFDTSLDSRSLEPDSSFQLNGFAPTTHTATELAWRAIDLDGVTSPLAFLAIDIPNAGPGIPATALVPKGYLMTLRHRPLAIPEPATVLPFLGLAIGGLLRRRQRFSNQA